MRRVDKPRSRSSFASTESFIRRFHSRRSPRIVDFLQHDLSIRAIDLIAQVSRRVARKIIGVLTDSEMSRGVPWTEREREKRKKERISQESRKRKETQPGVESNCGRGGDMQGQLYLCVAKYSRSCSTDFRWNSIGEKSCAEYYRLKKEVINFQLKAWISYFDLLKDLCNYQINFFNYSLHLYIYIFSLFPNKFFLDLILSMKN